MQSGPNPQVCYGVKLHKRNDIEHIYTSTAKDDKQWTVCTYLKHLVSKHINIQFPNRTM